ncbi:MAG: hypothetical protein JO051_14780 [Acidobacteriaceae bacterium]|nr:hypothetical protein [Acidobacteriaceae bacterium]
MKTTIAFSTLLALLITGQWLARAERSGLVNASGPELWFMNHSYLTSDDALLVSKKRLDEAAAFGYNGVIFWDSGWNFMSDEFWPVENEGRLGELVKYAEKKGMRTMGGANPYGYSNEVLDANPNWAESQRVVGSLFQVDPSGRRLLLMNTVPALKNAGFEQGRSDWFGTNDPGIGIDTTGHSGHAAGQISNAGANARFRQKFSLKPWRHYHVRLWVKTEKFGGTAMVQILDSADFGLYRLGYSVRVAGTQDWMPIDLAFNSGDSSEAYLYFGVWGGSSGKIWFDDVAVEETALVYVTRRPGTPLRIYDPSDPTTVYQEGADYDPIADPRMSERNAFRDSYHNPPTVTLPAHTRLKPRQIVAMDYYAAFPFAETMGMSMCMTEPAAWKWVRDNTQAFKKVMPRDAGVLLGYDEIRQMNSCGSCRARKMDAGALLAWSIQQLVELHKRVTPNARLYIFSDMVDPYHNAQKHFYSVEGDLTGGWKGVSPDIIIVNWNLGNLKESLGWFAGQDPRWPVPHQQIIAGFYDNPKGGAAAAEQELSQAAGKPGILGLAYLSYSDNYSQLKNFADSARANWPSYEASLHSR